MSNLPIVAHHEIENRIFLVRDHRVMLDSDLAKLYGVTTGRLNEQVRRNITRFPSDFMFELTGAEFDSLKSQFAISKKSGRGGRRKLPRVFTQEGVAMLSGVLRSRRAVLVNVEIMRTFIRLREVLGSHREVKRKLNELEQRVGAHDEHIHAIFEALKRLIESPKPSGRKIGF